MTDYNLNKNKEKTVKGNFAKDSLKKLFILISSEKLKLFFALLAVFINSLVNLAAPAVMAYVIDNYIVSKNYSAVLNFAVILFIMFLFGLLASYLQTQLMGDVGQRVLFKLRNKLFSKIQELPLTFFNQNKSGDLISRINNDTDKLNTFFSQSLVQLAGNLFIMLGAAIFLISLKPQLGLASLIPALVLFFITRIISPWVKGQNKVSMASLGNLSSQVQQSLSNFKVIIAFNRRDFLKDKFEEANEVNYKASVKAGVANNFFSPIYGLASNVAQLIVLTYGIYLISVEEMTIGLLIGFLAYVNSFYRPLRHFANLWANFQVALAGWDRITEILSLKSDLTIVDESGDFDSKEDFVLEFKKVNFKYPKGNEVLHNVSFSLEKGKTYALVGPTGGGKTTIASLMARLFDPSLGEILFKGRNIKSYSHKERTDEIGFILQDPFLFNGTLKDNILYGNDHYQDLSKAELEKVLKERGLDGLLSGFRNGLEEEVSKGSDVISLGQKQLVAFVRAVLRDPKLIILDEATANLDTVTEKILDKVLAKLSQETTKVIIAHRLSTIANADQIFFVNSGYVELAGSFEHALDMLMNGQRNT